MFHEDKEIFIQKQVALSKEEKLNLVQAALAKNGCGG